MKGKCITTIIGIISLALVAYSAQSDSQQQTAATANFVRIGLAGKRVYSISVDRSNPAVVYATSDGWIWKSIDSGATWNRLSIYLSGVPQIQVHPLTSNIVCCGSYCSEDGGSSWTQISISGKSVEQCSIDPRFLNIRYAFIGERFYRSNNCGLHWLQVEKLEGGLGCGFVKFRISPVDSTIYADYYIQRPFTIESSAQWQIFYWKIGLQGGDIWKNPGGLSYQADFLLEDPRFPGVVYAALGDTLVMSSDYGQSWSTVGKGIVGQYPCMYIGPLYHDMYIAGADFLKVSRDDGLTWETLWSGKNIYISYLEMNGPENILYAGTNDGIYAMVYSQGHPRILLPQTGATVYGDVEVVAQVMDDAKPTGVYLYVDDVSLGEMKPASGMNYRGTWDTRLLLLGEHTVRVLAWDALGLIGENSVKVNVRNLELALRCKRVKERAWLARRDVALVEINVQNLGGVVVDRYSLYRSEKKDGYQWVLVQDFGPSAVVNGKISWWQYVTVNREYTYRVEARNADRTLIGSSDNVTLER